MSKDRISRLGLKQIDELAGRLETAKQVIEFGLYAWLDPRQHLALREKSASSGGWSLLREGLRLAP
jgi:hypothetical protein